MTAYNKLREERNELKTELLSKKEPYLKDLGISQPVRLTKIRKCVWETALMGVEDCWLRLV